MSPCMQQRATSRTRTTPPNINIALFFAWLLLLLAGIPHCVRASDAGEGGEQQQQQQQQHVGVGNHQQNSNNNDSTQVERHMLIMGCRSPYWIRMKEKLEAGIDFTSSTCMFSEQDEQHLTQRLLERKLNSPSTEMHLVATIITRNHCDNGDECRAVNPGDRYLPLLRAGIQGWFIESEPDFEALGVFNRTEQGIKSTELFPDNADGGRQVAAEFCRISGSIAPANIAVLYGAREAAHSTARIDNFITGLEQLCPEARHVIKYRFYADWNAEKAAAIMSPIFLRDGSIDAVVTANDDMALGALVSAREMRPQKHLLVAGYDANEYVTPLLQSGAMFATVDQNPPTGIVYSLQALLSDEANGANDFGSPTNCSITPAATCRLEDYNVIQESAWGDLLTSLPEKVSTAVTIRVKDPSALVLRERLLLYNPAIRPPLSTNQVGADHILQLGELPPLPVLSRLVNTKVYELHAESSSILAQGLLVLSWEDNRLSWSEFEYPDIQSIQLSGGEESDIWRPVVVLSNLLKSGSAIPMTDISTTIYPNGTVVWEQTVNAGEFRCGTIEETVFKFPFDVHMCGIDVTSYIVGSYTLVADNSDFEVVVANSDWFQGRTEVTLENTTDSQTVYYKVEMERDPLFTQLSLIIPSFLLNTISFAQHWIPTRTDQVNLDRGGMAITTILAALALRDTMISEVGTAFTLLDLFLLISLVFQFAGFMITAYESSYGKCKVHAENQLGMGDRLGKVVMPLVFGLWNVGLSLFWGDGVWSLFYMSVALCFAVSVLARKDRRRFQKHLRESVTKSLGLKHRLGLVAVEGERETPQSIIRYWKWHNYRNKELRSRHGSLVDTGSLPYEKMMEDTSLGQLNDATATTTSTRATAVSGGVRSSTLSQGSVMMNGKDGTVLLKNDKESFMSDGTQRTAASSTIFFSDEENPASPPRDYGHHPQHHQHHFWQHNKSGAAAAAANSHDKREADHAASTLQRAYRRHAKKRKAGGRDSLDECIVM